MDPLIFIMLGPLGLWILFSAFNFWFCKRLNDRTYIDLFGGKGHESEEMLMLSGPIGTALILIGYWRIK